MRLKDCEAQAISAAMAEQHVSVKIRTLRLLTQRIEGIQSGQNSQIAAALASELSRCGDLFSLPASDAKTREGPDVAVLTHKFKTQVTALFNSKKPEQRYAAVVLAHAAVQIGGFNILQATGPWVKALLTMLKVRLLAQRIRSKGMETSSTTDVEW